MRWRTLCASALAIGTTASAQVMPTQDKTVSRTLPEESGFKNDTEYKRKFEEMRKQLDALQQTQESAQRTLQAAGPVATPTAVPTVSGTSSATPAIATVPKTTKTPRKR